MKLIKKANEPKLNVIYEAYQKGEQTMQEKNVKIEINQDVVKCYPNNTADVILVSKHFGDYFTPISYIVFTQSDLNKIKAAAQALEREENAK